MSLSSEDTPANVGFHAKFGLEAKLAGYGVVVKLTGGIANEDAGEVEKFFDAVIASGYFSIVLELERLDLIDSAGLRVITNCANSFMASGGELILRSRIGQSDFSSEEYNQANILVSGVSGIASDEQANITDDELGERLRKVLLDQELIPLAQGIIMEREGTDPQMAHKILIDLSQERGISLLEIAQALVTSTMSSNLSTIRES